jgi:hypothetical protein
VRNGTSEPESGVRENCTASTQGAGRDTNLGVTCRKPTGICAAYKRLNITILAFLVSVTFTACTSAEDRAEAKVVADKIHAHLISSEFAAIYDESAPRFKTVGSKHEFVSQMTSFHERVGLLNRITEIAYESQVDSSIGKTHVLLFKLEYEHGTATERLTIVRSPAGDMQLWKLDLQPVD